MTNTTKVFCKGCGRKLDENPSLAMEKRTPCPGCGSVARHNYSSHSESITPTGMVSVTRIRQFYDRHRTLFWLWVVLTFGAAFLGVVFQGWLGVLASLVAAVVLGVLGVVAVTKVREIEHF